MTGYMFVYHCPYNGYIKGRPDPSIGVALNFNKAKEILKNLTKESIDMVGFPFDCYEKGYGETDFPPTDKECAELWEKIRAETDDKTALWDAFDAAIEKHRIKDFDSLMEYLCEFNPPPEDFYGLIKVEIIE